MNEIAGLRVDRRTVMRVGGAGLFGLSLPQLLAARETRKPRAKAVIFLHQFGGPPGHETFDMKPNAPAEVRGSFKPIASKVPGLQVCEMLGRVGEVADKLTVIRCVQHTMKNHNSAGYYSLTGHAPADRRPTAARFDRLVPGFRLHRRQVRTRRRKAMPTFVAYPHVIRDGSITPGQHASFLGKTHNPFFVHTQTRMRPTSDSRS